MLGSLPSGRACRNRTFIETIAPSHSISHVAIPVRGSSISMWEWVTFGWIFEWCAPCAVESSPTRSTEVG